ncbi:MAG: hypothetical protein HKN79_05985 [Flavobacteriales bacterium]|nr:hypothetical protein [Flavobacteriales bacterium]
MDIPKENKDMVRRLASLIMLCFGFTLTLHAQEREVPEPPMDIDDGSAITMVDADTPNEVNTEVDYRILVDNDMEPTQIQTTRIEDLDRWTMRAMKRIHEEHPASSSSYQAEVERILSNRDDRLGDILSPAQYHIYVDSLRRHHAHDEGHYSHDIALPTLESSHYRDRAWIEDQEER